MAPLSRSPDEVALVVVFFNVEDAVGVWLALGVVLVRAEEADAGDEFPAPALLKKPRRVVCFPCMIEKPYHTIVRCTPGNPVRSRVVSDTTTMAPWSARGLVVCSVQTFI